MLLRENLWKFWIDWKHLISDLCIPNAMFSFRILALLPLVSKLVSSQCTTSTITNPSSSSLPMIYSSNTVPTIDQNSVDNDPNYTAPYFPLLGFKEYANNPILSPNPAQNWESAYLYNPSAIVLDGKVWLLVSHDLIDTQCPS